MVIHASVKQCCTLRFSCYPEVFIKLGRKELTRYFVIHIMLKITSSMNQVPARHLLTNVHLAQIVVNYLKVCYSSWLFLTLLYMNRHQ